MTKQNRKIYKQVVMLLLTGLLLWLAMRNITTEDGVTKTEFVLEAWAISNKPLLLLSGVVALLSHLARSERWKLLLHPLGYPLSGIHSFLSVMVGYFVNLAIPRGGELSRCYNLYQLNETPVNISFGTVLSERLVDLVFLLTLIGVVFIWEFDLFINFFSELPVQFQDKHIYWLVIFGVLFVILIVILSKLIFRKIKNTFLEKIRVFLVGIKSGVLSIARLENRGAFIFYSLAIWVSYYLMHYLVIKAFPATASMGLMPALTIFIIGGIALALPLPGGAGSYHILVPLGLSLIYGVEKSDALAFAVVVHAWQTLVVILAGVLSLITSQFLIKKYNINDKREDTVSATTQRVG